VSTFRCWVALGVMVGIFIGSALPAAAVTGDIIYVDQFNTSGTEDGRSWATAYRSIQAGIESARQRFGGEVWVTGGVYDEARGNAGALRLRPNVRVYGGFTGAEIARNQRNFETNLTIVDGQRSNNGNPAETVVLGANDAVLDGFVIRGGRSVSGSGMLNVSVSPRVVNCVFVGNEAEDFGAAVLNVDRAAPRFENCTFRGNVTLGSGGGMGIVDSDPVLEGCTFIDNDALEAGGALFMTGESTVLIRNSVFIGNTSVTGGAALFNDGGNLSVESSEFYDNETDGFGGMVFNNEGSDTLVINSVIARNYAGTGGAAISSLGSRLTSANCTFVENISPVDGSALHNNASETNVINAVIWYNSHPPFFNLESVTSIRWSNVGGGDRGPNNIAQEPRFVDLAGGDYRLRPDSPSVNAGTMNGAPTVDIRGVSRPQGSGVDMGAYEIEDGVGPAPHCHGIIGATGAPTLPGAGETLVLGALLLALFFWRTPFQSQARPIGAT